ncbi:acetyl-CoA synthetase-like protein [Amniculicola lignicola CBS 123094]|uniref:Acetyl-CoA synthetase-like protein n=1 Tax=Amniculicola lignicola CBS 123094 TaxID=1392246 RepID=A0A6A5WUJ5_9PLEO|nr:acetyl-CoA synthetase-like protein [Amniculicola lignicola CBS 123094]
MSLVPFIRSPINLKSKGEPLTNIWTLPDIVDFNAKHNQDFVFCHQARRYGQETRLLAITHLALRNAVLECQSWLLANITGVQKFGETSDVSPDERRPIALFMESDVGLWIHILALLGLDVPVLLLSARLGATPAKHLLDKTNAWAAIVSPRLQSTLDEGLGLGQLVDTVPTYKRQPCEYFLQDNANPTDSPERQSVCLVNRSRIVTSDAIILHSSGTTGLPKPIYHPHQYLLGFAAAHAFKELGDIPSLNCSTLPLYHNCRAHKVQGFGLVAPCLSMSIGMAMCLPVSNVASPTTILQLLEDTSAESLMTVPSILEDITLLREDAWAKTMSRLKFVAFGGGPLKETVGECLSNRNVRLLNHYGATEVGALAPIFSPKDGSGYDYHYFRLRKDFNLEIRQVEPDMPDRPLYKLTAHPFGWSTPFEVQDNLVSNPNHPETDFNAIGRNDDLIVLSTGEKVLPNMMENFITESKLVKLAMVFGQNQFQVGLLVQPTVELLPQEHEAFRDIIWPIVEQANEMVDNHARVSSKKAIAVVSSTTVIPRTDKGSIARKEVNAAFEHEFAEVFAALENDEDSSIPELNLDNLKEDLKELVQTRLAWKVPGDKWTYEDDLFELGMDSLQALQLRRLIISSIPHFDVENTPRDFVYQNPSILALTEKINGGNVASLEDSIENFCCKYVPGQKKKGFVVVLTGATGSLGSHLVSQLASMPSVERVVCLNREKRGYSPLEQQFAALESRKIALTESAWSKVEAFQTDTSRLFLGLPELAYVDLQNSVTHIIHNAWPMDFNRRIASFETQFRTLDNLFCLARACHARQPLSKPTVLFVSSIAVVGQYPKLTGELMVPEIVIRNNRCADDFGYAQAKLVCERMIEGAAKMWGDEIKAKYVRVGQMTGAEDTGLWNTTEHFPSLVKSSRLIGAMPDLKGTLSWLPVDHAAAATIDMLLNPSPDIVFHLENPIRQSWADVLRVIAGELGLGGSGAFIPYKVWLSRVLAVPDEKMDANPAKKLAAFFEGDFEHMSGGEIILDTAQSRRASKSLRYQRAVGDELVRRYVEGWKKAGFLSQTGHNCVDMDSLDSVRSS